MPEPQKRFVLSLEPVMTFKEIAQVMDCSPELIRNLEASALQKLREHCTTQGVTFRYWLDP